MTATNLVTINDPIVAILMKNGGKMTKNMHIVLTVALMIVTTTVLPNLHLMKVAAPIFMGKLGNVLEK